MYCYIFLCVLGRYLLLQIYFLNILLRYCRMNVLLNLVQKNQIVFFLHIILSQIRICHSLYLRNICQGNLVFFCYQWSYKVYCKGLRRSEVSEIRSYFFYFYLIFQNFIKSKT